MLQILLNIIETFLVIIGIIGFFGGVALAVYVMFNVNDIEECYEDA